MLWAGLKYAVAWTRGALHEVAKSHLRSTHWPKVRDAFLHANASCAACGGTVRLEVHHIQPFHIRPSLELDPTNLITLCRARPLCHLRIGHGGSYDCFNPYVVADANYALRHSEERARIENGARLNRLSVEAS